jgi:hypothetical protein
MDWLLWIMNCLLMVACVLAGYLLGRFGLALYCWFDRLGCKRHEDTTLKRAAQQWKDRQHG